MDTTTLIVLAAVLLLIVALCIVLLGKSAKSKHLKSHFGPEYERTIAETGDPKRAEAELREREKRVKQFELHPLQPGDRARFTTAWTQVQAEFVDDPKGAVTHADDLLGDVMRARGYPVGDFEQRSADLSVQHPVLVQNYRAAREITVRHRRGEAGTEDLRQAMIHFRALFEELSRLDADPPATAPPPVSTSTRIH